MRDVKELALQKHYEWRGKIEVISRVPVNSSEALSLAYTPGVAQPCLEIEKDINKSYSLTRRHNLVGVITDGSAVLGLGNIGPEAGMPVMEGKCVLFKELGGVDALPICIKSNDVDELVRTIYLISGGFGGINLEDIAAPRCFEVERKLKEICDIPIFHDDQHGTAIVLGGALINALKLVEKKIEDIKCVINGAGAAGVAIGYHLIGMGVNNIIMCDKFGAISRDDNTLANHHKELAEKTNPGLEKGPLSEIIKGANVFIGVSAPNIVTENMIKSMGEEAIVFALANPIPEIMPDEAKKAGAAVVGSGRSDFPNQVNNVLAFPGIFKGALSVYASDINDEMKLAASYAIASLVSDEELNEDYILPMAFDPRVADTVAEAVAKAARDSGVARI
ncbi:MAG: NADP-dependent malic enzyme [Clostridiales bacterium]|nr:NADP-dependent malic enzyme [Clostridiales bacterium]